MENVVIMKGREYIVIHLILRSGAVVINFITKLQITIELNRNWAKSNSITKHNIGWQFIVSKSQNLTRNQLDEFKKQ